ncbi:hypothetical protein N7465_001202 [Penicillium sp. CMV-2018d]|nr:hypothetical protein N7465_001202 [Penicillium sp. CMV-2018d]
MFDRSVHQLLALIAWLNLMWGSYYHANLLSDTFIPSWMLPPRFFASLGAEIQRLCPSFQLLARNHIYEHSIHPGCSCSRRAQYRDWLLHCQPIPVDIELDGSPDRFADFSLSKHRPTGTEDHVHNWYGAIVRFRRRVTEIVEEGTLVSAH